MGPIPAYNLLSRSRAADIWCCKSEAILELLNVGDTTSDCRAPLRLPSMTCHPSVISQPMFRSMVAYIQSLLGVG